MNFEISDHVPGLSDEAVSEIAREAASGYGVEAKPEEPNPHFQGLQLVPEDLLEAINARALRDGQSTEAIVRQALTAYLRTA